MMGIIVLRFFCHSSMLITSVRAAWSAVAADLALVDGWGSFSLSLGTACIFCYWRVCLLVSKPSSF